MQYDFYRYPLLADLLWVVVERAFTKNSRKAGTWLFGALLWKIIKALRLVKHSSKFFFIDRRSSNSEYPGLWYAMVFDWTSYNLGHNILELDNVLVEVLLTTSKTKPGIIIANLVYELPEELPNDLRLKSLRKYKENSGGDIAKRTSPAPETKPRQ